MGGIGSSRWELHRKATTVEDCRVLDLGLLARQHAFVPWYQGNLRWTSGDRELASIGFFIRPAEHGGLILELRYRLSATAEDVAIPVRIESTRPHFGGVRWWGRCPLILDGRNCHRRIGKLYLPPWGRYFGCRHCYRLAYRSAQEHDSRVDLLRRDPEGLAAIIGSHETESPGRLLLAIKALR